MQRRNCLEKSISADEFT